MKNEPILKELPALYSYFKFGSKEHMEDLQQKGHIYMKNLSYFIKLEKEGQGDKAEGRICEFNELKFYDFETNKLVMEGKGLLYNKDDRRLWRR